MADLVFECLGTTADIYAAGPTLTIRLRATERTGATVHAIALRAQLRIEPQKRRYSATEAARLGDLFGETNRWADTLRPLQFAMVPAMVPGFTDSCEFDLPVPCTYDLEIAATTYFHALEEGDIPLVLLFSGTVFTKGDSAISTGGGSGFSVSPVSWRAEAPCLVPVVVWRQMMDRFFPNCGWVRLSRDTLHALGVFKNARAIPTWEQAITELLADVREPT
ncbi:MAG TPA: DUF6084 family protein [Sporichthyaceae bacterium]|jgi:hypothetical protein|nr:DUF6084 family protein [Sporichthyaceae bacterium]